MTKLLLSTGTDDGAHAQQLSLTGFWGKEGAGCLVMAMDTKKFLLQLRGGKVLQPNTWGIWGGAVNQNETPLDAALRELREESGTSITGAKISKLWVYRDPSGFRYTTYLVLVPRQFTPVPDTNEVADWGWFDFYDMPKPLHFGVKALLQQQDVRTQLLHASESMPSFAPSLSKQVGTLYHATGKDNAVQILQSGNLVLATGRAIGVETELQSDSIYFASLTRSRVGAYHFGEDGSRTNKVIFTLDGTALSHRYKIRPVDYWKDNVTNARSEAEERLLSDKRSVPIIKYIKRMDIVVPAVEYAKDAKTLAARGKGLSTLVLLAKKLGIPYAFYQDMLDWSQKRGEFYPTSMSPASRKRNTNNYDYKELRAMLQALTMDPAEIDGARDYEVVKILRSPAQAYVTYTNNTRGGTGPIMTVMDRISRVLKRLGIRNRSDFENALKLKAQQVSKIAARAKAKESAEDIANSIIRIMTLPKQKWLDKDFLYMDPKYDDMSDTKISYYLDSYVQDYGHTPVTEKAYSLLNTNSLYTPAVLNELRAKN